MSAMLRRWIDPEPRCPVEVVLEDRVFEAIARLGTTHVVLETDAQIPFGAEARVRFGACEVPVVVRWNRDDSVGLQCVGLRARDVWSIHRLQDRARAAS